jgi:hypothetical protein
LTVCYQDIVDTFSSKEGDERLGAPPSAHPASTGP